MISYTAEVNYKVDWHDSVFGKANMAGMHIIESTGVNCAEHEETQLKFVSYKVLYSGNFAPFIAFDEGERFLIVSSRGFRYAMQIREFVFVELASMSR